MGKSQRTKARLRKSSDWTTASASIVPRARAAAVCSRRNSARGAKRETVRKATTFRLGPRLRKGLALLGEIRRVPLNRLVNEAVGEYLETRSASVEADLEATLRRVNAFREVEPNFESAISGSRTPKPNQPPTATLRAEVMNDCDALPAAYPESGLAELPEFASRLEQNLYRPRELGADSTLPQLRTVVGGVVPKHRPWRGGDDAEVQFIEASAGVNRRERLQRSRNCAAGESDTGTTKPASHLR
jgi:hypothetical protein